MAFWSGETLASKLPDLIRPFDEKQIDCAAYTLRVGSEAYVSPSEAEQDPKKITIQRLGMRQSFPITAGQLAFLLTEEKVTVPRGAIAFISMKSGVKLRGLVNVSGFHVDPGYTGHLIFAVFNAGPRTIHLKQGEDCFLIWYADLDDLNSQKAKHTLGFNSISTEIVSKISGEVMSFDGLNAKIKDLQRDYEKRIHKIENDHRTITTVGKIILGVLLTLLVTVVLAPYAKKVWDSWPLSVIGTEPDQSAHPNAAPPPPARPPPQ